MTREEIIQAISDDKMMPFIQPDQLAQIVEFVIENYQPSLPSDLDEAAEDRVTENGRFELTACGKMRIDDIMFGAEWMAQQGVTRIVRANADLDPHGADYGIRYLNIRVEDDTPVGTMFIVQIRKK